MLEDCCTAFDEELVGNSLSSPKKRSTVPNSAPQDPFQEEAYKRDCLDHMFERDCLKFPIRI